MASYVSSGASAPAPSTASTNEWTVTINDEAQAGALIGEFTIVFDDTRDFGGTIYLVAPVDGVRCDEATLSRLLSDIDQMCWRDLEMARVAIERRPVGSGVAGGMGGGRVQKTLWLHPELEALGVRREIEDILAGKPYRLDPSGRRWD